MKKEYFVIISESDYEIRKLDQETEKTEGTKNAGRKTQ